MANDLTKLQVPPINFSIHPTKQRVLSQSAPVPSIRKIERSAVAISSIATAFLVQLWVKPLPLRLSNTTIGLVEFGERDLILV